jgi:hypothetical protein
MTLRRLVDDSGRELAAEIATDVLIIGDETFIAIDLAILVENLGHKVIGVARTHKEAAKRQHPKARTYLGGRPVGGSADPAAIGKATAIGVTDSGRSLFSLHL